MESFFLGLLSGVMLMLLKDLPSFIWKQPKVFWRVFIPVGGEGLAFAIVLTVFGSLWRFTAKDHVSLLFGRVMLAIGVTLGAVLLTAFAIAVLVDYAKDGSDEASGEAAETKRVSVKYQPQYRTASNRPKR